MKQLEALKRNIFTTIRIGFYSVIINFILGITTSTAQQPTKWSQLQLIEEDWAAYTDTEAHNYIQELEGSSLNDDIRNLKIAKLYLISGNTLRAKFFLNQIPQRANRVTRIKHKYLALVEFIEGQYQKSMDSLKIATDNGNFSLAETCPLRLLNSIPLRPAVKAANQIASCIKITASTASEDHYWWESMRKISQAKFNEVKGFRRGDLNYVFSTDENIKIWLKLGIFLDKYEFILENINNINVKSLENKEIRELIGVVYHNSGNFKKALNFINDLNTPNAENIKANIRIAEKQYELAFGHIVIAQKLKNNSLNAIERGLPLAVLLKKWDSGIEFLSNLLVDDISTLKKNILSTYFFYKKKEFDRVSLDIRYFNYEFKNKAPVEVSQIEGLLGIKENNRKKFLKGTVKACSSKDAFYCWLLNQGSNYFNFTEILSSKEDIYPSEFLNIDKFKEREELDPIDEVRLVNQSSIEELDSSDVKINF